MTEGLWKLTDVANHFGVSTKTVRRMRVPRVAIPGSGVKPIVRYDPKQVRAWWDAYRSKKMLRAG